MRDVREEWYDAGRKISVTFADATCAAQTLAAGHLCGPASAYFLSKALAAVALLGAETSEKDETVILQMKCDGPLGGFNVECTAEGTLRGYTERKMLDGFDGKDVPDANLAAGNRRIQVTRSVPGKILSQGISNSLDGYLAGSLQRKVCIYLDASVNNDVEIAFARGVLVEALPDSLENVASFVPENLSLEPAEILGVMGLSGAKLRKSTPLSFACRCSPERAAAALAALGEKERSELPEHVDITCHMCGRTFTVRTR